MSPTPSHHCPPEPAETTSARLVPPRSTSRHSAHRTRQRRSAPAALATDPTTSAPPQLVAHQRGHRDLPLFHPQPFRSAAAERMSANV